MYGTDFWLFKYCVDTWSKLLKFGILFEHLNLNFVF